MPSSNIIPRPETWNTLQNSRNTAAIAILTTGLSSTNAEVRKLSLQALMARKETAAREAVILNWECYDENDRELLRSKASIFTSSVNHLLANGNLAEKQCALTAIADLDLSDAIEVVLKIMLDPRHVLCPKATQCLTQMCERWGAKARMGKDVPTIRGKMLDRMNAHLAVYNQYKNTNLIDAWLCLVCWDDALQRGLVADSRQDAYRAVLDRLRESDRPAIIQLLAGYASRSATPKNVTDILVERSDTALAIEIAKQHDQRSLPGVIRRLQQLPALESLKQVEGHLQNVNVEVERRLWLMVAASSTDLGQVLRGACKLAKSGTREARQTAAEMIRICRRPELEQLVPAIQSAEFADSEDETCVGNLIHRVAGWLASPSLTLKKAAQQFFEEFTIAKLLEQVRVWPTEMCKAMASIVVIVEPDVTERLTNELQCPAPRRRLAALQATQLLDCVDQVSKILLPLLDDPRLEVRVRTIDLLGALGHESLETLLPQLLIDASTDIQDAANRAVRRLNRQKQKQAPAPK